MTWKAVVAICLILFNVLTFLDATSDPNACRTWNRSYCGQGDCKCGSYASHCEICDKCYKCKDDICKESDLCKVGKNISECNVGNVCGKNKN